MHLRSFTIALVFSGVISSSAAASTVLKATDGSSPQPYQEWVTESAMPTPSLTIRFFGPESGQNPCGSDAGGCFLQLPMPTIALLANGSPEWQRGALYHELGHALDELLLTTHDRNVFTHLLGFRVRDRDWGTLMEPFAQAYGYCALSATDPAVGRAVLFYDQPGYDYDPTVRDHYRACAFISAVATRESQAHAASQQAAQSRHRFRRRGHTRDRSASP